MELETPTATATPVWESTFDECLERCAQELMSNGEYNLYCDTSLGEHFQRMSRAARPGPYGVGDSNRYCDTSLGEHF